MLQHYLHNKKKSQALQNVIQTEEGDIPPYLPTMKAELYVISD